ncbi:uncharacterized protein PGTG_21295 [Puccinia graminis f. sp. tritici CRL 75-36-700-3]|uniref:Uncharacterized protein n=1 Tax=Puccinia graminis f. sp. tritici (strain CRL 75-36-700-3 / race SCCL) TaxID=418459 RepID=H6QR28_PUCGT|nr:uncharacterized protein PGTG_21295 [Puccinia graminis f. sp. tritici CRL 75-36-700-3]EHS63003.1 hypothetical protein PGTG_21295 [Puccinia graminis f. sp. tritici CRL 75-36-700-3]
MQLLQLSIFTLAAVLMASLQAEEVKSEIGAAENKLAQVDDSIHSHEKRGLEKRKKKKGGGAKKKKV